MTNYVGMDVHDTSTTVVTQDDDGREASRSVIRTRPNELIATVDGYHERTEVVFEEAQWAAWLYELLDPHVDRVEVHAAEEESNKTDALDAARLAKLLRLGEINKVYHGSEVDTELKMLVKGYHRAAKDVRAEKSRLSNFFIAQQIDVPGEEMYDAEKGLEWIDKLVGHGAQLRADHTHERLQLARAQKQEMKKAMKRAGKRREGWSSISSLPGFGVVRTSTVLGLVGTPWRFPSAKKLCSYVGLGVDFDESSEYETNAAGELERREKRKTKGLTDDYNRQLKNVFKGATETAIQHYDEVWEDFQARCRDKADWKAKLDIARKLVSQCWTIWRRKEEYDVDKACWAQL